MTRQLGGAFALEGEVLRFVGLRWQERDGNNHIYTQGEYRPYINHFIKINLILKVERVFPSTTLHSDVCVGSVLCNTIHPGAPGTTSNPAI